MEAVKKKLVSMKEQAELSEERIIRFEAALSRSKQHLEAALKEKESLLRRIDVVERAITQADRLREDLGDKIQGLERNTDVSECKRRVLENRELEGDESIVKLEERLKYAQRAYQEHAVRCEESERRLTVLRDEFEKVQDKRHQLEDKAGYLDEEIDHMIMKLRPLEHGETKRYQKECINDDKLKYLEAHCVEAEERKEIARLDVLRLQRLIDKAQDDIEDVQAQTKAVRIELENTIHEVVGSK